MFKEAAASPAAVAEEKTITLKTDDSRVFTMPRKIVAVSGTISEILRDLGLDDDVDFFTPIPLPNVSGPIFEKIVEWCSAHKDDALNVPIDPREQRTDDIPQWDQDFLKVEQAIFFEIILAVYYLDIKPLQNICLKTVSNMIKGKSIEEIRATFGIENDYTPEEEEQIRREKPLARELRRKSFSSVTSNLCLYASLSLLAFR